MERLQVHVPYATLAAKLDEVIRAGFNPEIFIDGADLDRIVPDDLLRVRRAMDAKGRTVTVHGPYMDMSPGGGDEKMRLATSERFRQTFAAAALLGAGTVVLHGGYDERRFDGDDSFWLDRSLRTWPEFIREAERLKMTIAVENIFEGEPGPLKALMESFRSPHFGICLDAGHMNLFSTVPMREWFVELGGFIAELHIHDNRGQMDEHLPVGEGEIDFHCFFSLVEQYTRDPVFTIEPHGGESGVRRAVAALARYLLPASVPDG